MTVVTQDEYCVAGKGLDGEPPSPFHLGEAVEPARYTQYRKKLGSKRNLGLIHLIPAETPPGLYMFESFHLGVVLLHDMPLSLEPFQPIAEHRAEYLPT
jgi:hypothetical protein